MTAARTLVVMAYGTPASPDEVEPYYTHIRRGRPPTPEQLADLVRRYEAIGGISPLRQRTDDQRAAIQRALDAAQPGRWQTVLGYKHTAPFIEDAVAAAAAETPGGLVALALAPHFSALSVGEYLSRATEAAGPTPIGTVRSWATSEAYVEFLAAEVRAGLAGLPDGAKVVFTAHSLPERVKAMGDPYPDELLATATAVANRVGLTDWAGWTVAWQSAGRTPEPWLGPDINAVIGDLAGTGRATGLLVCPCGFTSDHLEVRYDLDIEATATAQGVGLPFARTATVNDDPAVAADLAALVIAADPAP